MIHLQWETTASPERDAASPARDAVSPSGDLLASPNFRICDTTRQKTYSDVIKAFTKKIEIFHLHTLFPFHKKKHLRALTLSSALTTPFNRSKK